MQLKIRAIHGLEKGIYSLEVTDSLLCKVLSILRICRIWVHVALNRTIQSDRNLSHL